MSDSPRSLAALQHWMQSAITHPGGVGMGTGAESVESVIGRSHALSSIERLTIYNQAYFARLLECLRQEFSVLAKAIGDDLFDSFALGYLQEHPSQSYTIAELGTRFPEYLARSRPESDGLWPEFLIDLARLELTVNQVFDGPGCEGESLLTHEQLATIAPEQWPEARLTCVPCLKLLALSFPVNDYFTAIRRGDSAEFPEPVASYVAVTRREFRVHRYPLTTVSHTLLAALQSGMTVGAAIEEAAAVSTSTDEELMRDLQAWFYTWTSAGFFRSVEHPGERVDLDSSSR